jgi:hypothetical protein
VLKKHLGSVGNNPSLAGLHKRTHDQGVKNEKSGQKNQSLDVKAFRAFGKPAPQWG